MLVFWDKVNELNVPVYLHPREPLEGPARGIYTGYESLIGSAWASLRKRQCMLFV